MQNKTILIADDHVIIRRGLKMLISIHFNGYKTYEVSSISELMNALNKTTITHLILDLQLADGNSIARISEIKKHFPNIAIMVYTMNTEELFASRVYAMGANMFVSKQDEEEEVVTKLNVFLNKNVNDYNKVNQIYAESTSLKNITERELSVALGLVSGKSIKELSIELDLKPSTVATYKVRLFEKLGVKNIIEFKTIFDAYQTEYKA